MKKVTVGQGNVVLVTEAIGAVRRTIEPSGAVTLKVLSRTGAVLYETREEDNKGPDRLGVNKDFDAITQALSI